MKLKYWLKEKMKNLKVEIIGCMDNTIDHTFESANRVYGANGLCPTIPTCGGGGIQPKILVKIYERKDSSSFIRGELEIR